MSEDVPLQCMRVTVQLLEDECEQRPCIGFFPTPICFACLLVRYTAAARLEGPGKPSKAKRVNTQGDVTGGPGSSCIPVTYTAKLVRHRKRWCAVQWDGALRLAQAFDSVVCQCVKGNVTS